VRRAAAKRTEPPPPPPPPKSEVIWWEKSVEEVYQHCWNHRFDALLDSCNGIEDRSVDRDRHSMQQAALEFAGE